MVLSLKLISQKFGATNSSDLLGYGVSPDPVTCKIAAGAKPGPAMTTPTAVIREPSGGAVKAPRFMFSELKSGPWKVGSVDLTMTVICEPVTLVTRTLTSSMVAPGAAIPLLTS